MRKGTVDSPRSGEEDRLERRGLDRARSDSGLKPARTYWYRFTHADGNRSRIGCTITAPLPSDPRPVNFVSCQDINVGKLNAFRRMIYEDERAPAAEKLDPVLHLGDFIYEVVEYPDEVKTRYDRTIDEVARIADGHKVGNFHIRGHDFHEQETPPVRERLA